MAEEQLDDEICGLQKSITVQSIILFKISHKITVEMFVNEAERSLNIIRYKRTSL